MNYVDGFVCAVPAANKESYREYAAEIGALIKKHGALSVIDCWGDDVPEGKVTSFPMAVKCEPGETVVFSWVIWISKEARNVAWETLMKEPKMQPDATRMPFDGKRMIYGGFETISEL